MFNTDRVSMQYFFQRHKVVLLHLSFWLIYFNIFLFQVSVGRRGEEINFNVTLLDAATQVFFFAIAAYLHSLVFFPRLLRDRNLWLYLASTLVVIGLITLFLVEIKKVLYTGVFDEGRIRHFFSSFRFYLHHVISLLAVMGFVTMLQFVERWFDLESRQQELENEKLVAELQFLKAQINPHFLFNTLNNLYFLSMTQSPRTPEVIERLSGMMRYMLYDSNHPLVPLTKEIEYMKNYISLEKLRLDSPVPVHFAVSGQVERVQIVPLILITFLENAFKHGVSNNFADSFVSLSVSVVSSTCIFTVDNSKLPPTLAPADKSGIGLQNVQRRLDLSYPDRHELTVQEDENTYHLTLTLEL